jgi:hypothetical protein
MAQRTMVAAEATEILDARERLGRWSRWRALRAWQTFRSLGSYPAEATVTELHSSEYLGKAPCHTSSGTERQSICLSN